MSLKRLIEDATPLPWYLTIGAADEQIVQSAAINEDNFVCFAEGDSLDQAQANAILLIHSVNMFPEVVEILEDLFNDWTTLVGQDLKENNEDVKELWDRAERILSKSDAPEENI